jgi:hypothetical protein
MFPVSTEIDLSKGEVIPLELQESTKYISKVSKDALHDFFKIVCRFHSVRSPYFSLKPI